MRPDRVPGVGGGSGVPTLEALGLGWNRARCRPAGRWIQVSIPAGLPDIPEEEAAARVPWPFRPGHPGSKRRGQPKAVRRRKRKLARQCRRRNRRR